MSAAAKCEFCEKRGLPLLLARDAVAPAGAGAPLAPALPIELDPKAAYYTKRLLRSGYVNIFDVARRRWETYFVTSDGYLFKMMGTPGVSPVVPAKPFNCPDEGHRAIASCITVPDPLNATKVCIGFSDVLWTDAVRTANEDAAYRKRHMIEVDIKAVLQGGNTPHRSITQLDAVIAEYAMTPNLARANFSWSRFKFDSRFGRADRLKQECEAMRPGKGIIVTVPDPAGLAQELASLMKRNAELFITARPIDQRNLAASAAIDQIEEAIRMQGQHTEIAAAEQIADQRMQANPIEHWLSESARAKTENFRIVTIQHLESAADAAWTKYAKKFDDVARKAWNGPFTQRLKDFDAVFIAPLAFAHVAWMKSVPLADYFECNYDPFHPESGAVYTRVFTECISATEDKKACADLYVEWLAGKVSDTKNLLLRSMLLNQNTCSGRG